MILPSSAYREGLREAMRRDPRVFLMGEDAGHYGGCFRRELQAAP